MVFAVGSFSLFPSLLQSTYHFPVSGLSKLLLFEFSHSTSKLRWQECSSSSRRRLDGICNQRRRGRIQGFHSTSAASAPLPPKVWVELLISPRKLNSQAKLNGKVEENGESFSKIKKSDEGYFWVAPLSVDLISVSLLATQSQYCRSILLLCCKDEWKHLILGLRRKKASSQSSNVCSKSTRLPYQLLSNQIIKRSMVLFTCLS